MFPDTTAGGAGDKAAASWFAERLRALAIPGYTQEFTAPLGDHVATLNNVAVVFPGESREAILVAAQRDPVLVGSSTLGRHDPASRQGERHGHPPGPHTGVRGPASREDPDLPIQRRRGLRGAGCRLLPSQRSREGATSAWCCRCTVSGARIGTTSRRASKVRRAPLPGGICSLPRQHWTKQASASQSPGLATQVANHALVLCSGEQTAGLRLGVPALMLFDTGPGRTTAAGLAIQGASMERLVLSLDAGTEIPSDPGTAVVLSSGRYLTSRALGILGALMLLPGSTDGLHLAGRDSDPARRLAALLAQPGVVRATPAGPPRWCRGWQPAPGLLPLYGLPAPPQDPPARQSGLPDRRSPAGRRSGDALRKPPLSWATSDPENPS